METTIIYSDYMGHNGKENRNYYISEIYWDIQGFIGLTEYVGIDGGILVPPERTEVPAKRDLGLPRLFAGVCLLPKHFPS